jgi:S-adenosyl-L-methionine hydrolase (adenosine-forming)
VASWQPCGLITLTTDYGLTDPFVGVMKGRILQGHPQARIVDLTHGLPAFQPRQAGFWLARSWESFAPGTVHVAVVDPGVGTARDIIAVQAAAQCWLAPDNGLLVPLVRHLERKAQVTRVRRCDPTHFARFGVTHMSATFHGRDIFAPLAASLAAGHCAPEDLGATLPASAMQGAQAALPGDASRGSVMAIDHYGNLITDIEAPTAGRFEVQAGNRCLPLLRTYGDVASGEYLALVNAFGVVEIARREGNAAQGLGLGYGAKVSLVAKS